MKIDTLAQRILEGDRRAAARLMRHLEDRTPGTIDEMRKLFPHTGRARLVGITGNPGSGKSTIADHLVTAYRASGKTVGVVAVDPSSPFSGGAILGDRVRMQNHSLDPGVFIRSQATRGNLGGLAKSTADVVAVLDAMGFDLILVETVGVGQDEVDVIKAVDTCVVVLIPGLGDEIQSMKAGILEIADIFVVNKCDRPGADKAVSELELLNSMRPPERSAWEPPIVQSIAVQGQGIEALLQAIEQHEGFLEESGEAAARYFRREENFFLEILRENALTHILDNLGGEAAIRAIIERIMDKQLDPYTAAEKVLAACSENV